MQWKAKKTACCQAISDQDLDAQQLAHQVLRKDQFSIYMLGELAG